VSFLSKIKDLEASCEYLHKGLTTWLTQLEAHRDKVRALARLVQRNITT